MSAADVVPEADSTQRRRAEVRDFKRQQILDAAAEVFASRGLEGASLRAIASEAGYTPAALYSYFEGKESMYAELLGQSLERLDGAIREVASHGAPAARARGAILAFFTYYRTRPAELDLGLYLFAGVDRRGLTPALDRQLNEQLEGSVRRMAEAVRAARGGSQRTAERDVVGAICHIVGSLTLERAGRLDLWGEDAESIVGRHVDGLLRRKGGRS